MTNAAHSETQPFRFLDRAPIVDDIVIVTPHGKRLFDVIALDELYGEFVYARPHDSADESPAQWYPLDHVKVVDDEDPNAWS